MGMIDNNRELARANESCRSVDVRRELALKTDMMRHLSPVDRYIFEASIKTPIYDMRDEELTKKLSSVVDMIRRDIGIKSIDVYEITRFREILKSYYSMLTLSEIKIAFELSMAGKLDDYLPKDRYGNPDNYHYHSFSVLYVTKILNAYLKRKSDTEYIVRNNVKEVREVPQSYKDYYAKAYDDILVFEFLRYKYTGVVNWTVINDFVVFEKLKEMGYDEPVKVTQEDKEQAVKRLLKKGQNGVLNKFVTDCVRSLQTKHQDVPSEAYFIARRKAILRSFDNMIKCEIQF